MSHALFKGLGGVMPLVHDAGITAEGQGVTLKEAWESLGGQLELHALDLDQLALGRFLRDNPTQFWHPSFKR